MNPKVSLILTTYNCRDHFIRTMESIASQDYSNIEVIIEDGCSTDGTIEIIKRYVLDFKYPVRWNSEKDSGIYDAINKGYKNTTGDIIGVFNDLYTCSNAVSQFVEAIMVNGTDGVHADLIYATDTEVKRYWHMGQGTIRHGWMPGHPTLYLKRDVYEKYGLYDTSYECSADFEFMVRILKDEKVKLAYIPQVLIRMYYGGTSTNSVGAYWVSVSESYRALKENNVKNAAGIIARRTMIVMRQFRRAKSLSVDKMSALRSGKYRFSIITVCYNAEDTIGATIDSLLMQKFSDYEYIIKDGGSTDSTLDIIRSKVKESKRIHIITEPDKGIYDAMNTAVILSNGGYIYFLNAGDEFAGENVLADIDSEIEQSDCDVIYGNVIQISGKDERLRKYGSICSKGMYNISGDCICHQALFARRELLADHRFDLSYKVCSDKEWQMYCIRNKMRFRSFDVTIARVLTEGFSLEHVKDFEDETMRLIEKYHPHLLWMYKIVCSMKNNRVAHKALQMAEKVCCKREK